jgi:hypothetical protein
VENRTFRHLYFLPGVNIYGKYQVNEVETTYKPKIQKGSSDNTIRNTSSVSSLTMFLCMPELHIIIYSYIKC